MERNKNPEEEDFEYIAEILLSDFGKIENVVQKKLWETCLKLPIENGRLTQPQLVLRKLYGLESTLNKALIEAGYVDKLKLYLLNFSEIDANNQQLQLAFNNIELDFSKFNPYKKELMDYAEETLLKGGLNENFVIPLRNGIYKHSVYGGTISDLENLVNEYVLSGKDTTSKLQRYVTQMARDTISAYDGAIQKKIAETYGMKNICYIGSIIKDSRPQCVRWCKKGILLGSELEEEIQWAYVNGSGMKKTTTKDNFYLNKGGWSCRHRAIATNREPQ